MRSSSFDQAACRRVLFWCLLCVLGALATPDAVRAQTHTAHSLDQVPALLQSPEAKSNFNQQIAGAPAPNSLGLHLPPALTAQAISNLMLPGNDKTPLNAVGAKPLPNEQDRYVAVVCLGGDIPKTADDTRCSQSGADNTLPLRAVLGVIEAKPGAPARLIAGPVTIDGMVNWRQTKLPSAPDALDDAKGDEVSPESFTGFDLAPYRISPDTTAIGLRGDWSAGYSGGGAEWTALYLFATVNGSLRQVLAVPMSSYQNIAGDWHKDGTRDHQITDVSNVLIVTPHAVDGHFDLLVKQRAGHAETLYRWSLASADYQPVKQG